MKALALKITPLISLATLMVSSQAIAGDDNYSRQSVLNSAAVEITNSASLNSIIPPTNRSQPYDVDQNTINNNAVNVDDGLLAKHHSEDEAEEDHNDEDLYDLAG